MDEFSLIRQYFVTPVLSGERDDVLLGVGDDCALLQVPAGKVLAVSVDTLVSGVHFFADVDPAHLGRKALAVNLSDLAAMGAEPLWFTLAITLPGDDAPWLAAFSAGLACAAAEAGIALVGGDTTRGPLSITIQVMGAVDAVRALRRKGAVTGEDIYVSGMVGSAALGLKARQSHAGNDPCASLWINALEIPQARLTLGRSLVGIASACIDVSDGLLQDLSHILDASGVGADIDPDAVPTPAWLPLLASPPFALRDAAHLKALCMNGGDDYELCFTAPANRRERVDALANLLGLPLTRIGVISATPGVRDSRSGQPLPVSGYRHF